MFQSARFKLTAWYLVIIMSISIAFSSFIYVTASHEFERIIHIQKIRLAYPIIQVPPMTNVLVPQEPDISQTDLDNLLADSKTRVFDSLLEINSAIFIFSAVLGYLLAGRTLKPIQKMVDEQNRFITDASHELNTPLTALRTTIEVNLREKKLSLEKAKKVLESNLEDVAHLQTLSDDLIKLTQYEKLNGSIEKTTLNVADITRTAIEKLTPLAEHKQIPITSSVGTYHVLGDERMLIELFVILLDNAIKYSPDRKPITLSSKKTDGKVQIFVTDKGIGMSEEEIHHMYDRFYRADTSRTKQYIPGYGLGLSIAKRIADFHHATLNAKSEKNKGTTFVITIPKA